MKFKYSFMSLLCATALTTGCNNEVDDMNLDNNQSLFPQTPTTAAFAPDDGATPLDGTPAMMVFKLLLKVGPDVAKGFGEISIKPEEYEEIKTFTDDLVKDCDNEQKKFEKIFRWLYKELKYEHQYEGGDFISNDPYPVFKTRTAICQGFTNLQHIMLESQGIPTLNVNGQYVNVGGHAWNYVFHSGKWWVSDATNNGFFQMLSTGKYKHLEPHSIDANLFETEECVCTFKDCALNIDSIKVKGSQFIVPFSVGGYKITLLSPTKAVPTNIKEIYIGSNITTLGEYYKGLEKNAPSIEAAYVDPKNSRLKSYTGAVYKKKGSQYELYYVPTHLKEMELLPMKVMEKNTIFDHKHLQKVIIPAGTAELQDYAFEKCPNLREAYVPVETKISDKAFIGVHPDFKIIRGDYTGIPEIRL